MLKMSGFHVFFAGAGNLYLLLAAMCIGLALWNGKTWARKLSYAALVLVCVVVPVAPEIHQTFKYQSKLSKAKALFEERCRTSGERIYKTAKSVDGLLLINPRPQATQGRDEADQNWGGAGLAGESTGNQYILNFLFYDVPSDGKTIRSLSPGGTTGPFGSIASGTAPEGTKGYGYVEIDEGEARIRYSLRPLSEYSLGNGPLNGYGKREVIAGTKPKYAVAYEDIADPEGRQNWIAGARVKVLNQNSGELMGELVQFSFEPGLGSRDGGRQPWAFSRQCSSQDANTRQMGAVRFFVEKILKPI